MSEIKTASQQVAQILDNAVINNLDSQLSVIIAVYDSLNYTKDCIESLQKHAPGAEIIIVNNGSQPETKEYLDSLDFVKKIHWAENLGVSKAWNAGIKIATRDMLCVLNNDVLVHASGLQRLVEAALVTGVAGNEGACMNTDFCYAYSTYNAEESDYLGGYCIVFTRDLWNKVGAFDELFSPAYWEDNDWSLRVKEAGYKWKIIPDCVFHYVARTSIRVLDMSALFAKQRIKFINKWNHKANGLGERILIECHDASTSDIQKCLTEVRQKKPFSKIQLLTESTDSFSGHDSIGDIPQYINYTQAIQVENYLQKPLLSFITWVNDEVHYRNLLKSSHNLKVEYIRLGQEFSSMSQAYNAGTEMANGTYLVYVHQDVEILDTMFESKLAQVFDSRSDLGFVGVIGSLTNDKAKSVWFHEGAPLCRGLAVQNRYEAVNLSIYNGEASLIDGLMMISDKKFNFPESLPHVHFLDAWMCNVAKAAGYRNWITDILVNHNSGGETQSDFFKNNLIRYRLKWFANGSWSNNAAFSDIKSMLKEAMSEEQVKSGIAITTRNRPEMLDACLTHFKTFTSEEALKHLVIYDDSSDYDLRLKNQKVVKKHNLADQYYVGTRQVGVAQAKNCCLYLLGNTYDYYFLFDDDTFPIKKDWIELYIAARHSSGFQHLVYGNDTHCSITGRADGIEFYNQGFGVLLFFTKEMYEKLGGFCTAYGAYGTEHTDLTLRAQKAGLTSLSQPYAAPINCVDYIWNVETRTEAQKTLFAIPMSEESMTRADKNKNLALSVNHDLTIYQDRPIYYPINVNHEITRIL
jgi:GT2 family glycosyltransferase